jgi:hypothetical protein
MCASCGCGKPNDQHGDPANITTAQVQDAARAAGISPEQVVDNLRQSI